MKREAAAAQTDQRCEEWIDREIECVCAGADTRETIDLHNLLLALFFF